MGCLCFGGGKQDLSDLSSPIDPAVPKPTAGRFAPWGLLVEKVQAVAWQGVSSSHPTGNTGTLSLFTVHSILVLEAPCTLVPQPAPGLLGTLQKPETAHPTPMGSRPCPHRSHQYSPVYRNVIRLAPESRTRPSNDGMAREQPAAV